MKPIRSVALVTVALALLAACAADDKPTATSDTAPPPEASSAASLSVVAPTPGTAVKGNVVSLDLAGTGLTIVKADGDTSGRSRSATSPGYRSRTGRQRISRNWLFVI